MKSVDAGEPTKRCTKCMKDRPLSMFKRSNKNPASLVARCKQCDREYLKRYREINREKLSAKAKIYYAENSDAIREANSKYRERNPEYFVRYGRAYYQNNKERFRRLDKKLRSLNPDAYREYVRRYRENNKGIINAKSARRRAAKRRAIPAWADFEAILRFYTEARERTLSEGVKYEVDHIVPLISPIVCGLHCQQNLMVVTEQINRAKNNRYWPDMPTTETN